MQKTKPGDKSFPSIEGRFGAWYLLRMGPFWDHGFWPKLQTAISPRLLGAQRTDGTRLLDSLVTSISIKHFCESRRSNCESHRFSCFGVLEREISRFWSEFLLSHRFGSSVSWFLLCEVHRSFVKSTDRKSCETESSWLANGMESDFLLCAISHSFIDFRNFNIFWSSQIHISNHDSSKTSR